MRRHKRAKLVITGCYAQMAASEIAEIVASPVCIIGNGNKHLLVETALNETPSDLTMLMGKILKKESICELPVERFGNRTRAYLRVQDGCNNFCTYCIVPYTRGPSRSLALNKVLEQAESFANNGHKEMVLTGIHVGMYGRDLDEGMDIGSLMRSLCKAHPDIRFRLSSIEPLEITDSLLSAMATCPNFMPHFHIPLQSGDDAILNRMRRDYDRETFRNIVQKCTSSFPDAALGIDILTGFPGEGEEEFNNSYALLKEIDASYFHVFPYSKRPGTLAASFTGQVQKKVSAERVATLRALSQQKEQAFYRRHLQTKRLVLVEQKRTPEKQLTGYTDNYIHTVFEGDDSLMGQIVTVKLQSIQNGTVLGTVV